MAWLVTGQASIILIPFFNITRRELGHRDVILRTLFLVVMVPLLFVPAIGGFITVGMMIKEFGSCTASI
jgi:hypothetical protein